MFKGYRASHLDPGKGESYHRVFSDNPYRKMVFEFEKKILDRVLRNFYNGRAIRHLDYACGTGRILAHYETRAALSVGIDLSASMLDVARRNRKRSQLIQADLTRVDVLGEQMFNLITVFRFFPNAEPELRDEALRILIKHLDKTGCMIFNNHRNSGSLRYRVARLCGRGGNEGMSMTEVEGMLARHNMEIVKRYHMCVFPSSESRAILPLCVLRPVESILMRFTILRNLGENLVFVCRRKIERSL